MVAIPIAYLAFGGLRDRGLTLAKPLGMLLVGYLTWILSAAHILPNSRFGPLVVLLLLAAVAAWIIHRRGNDLLAHIRSPVEDACGRRGGLPCRLCRMDRVPARSTRR